MPPALIRFHGTYRYRSREDLEHALVAARQRLDDADDERATASLRCMIKHGVVLSVDVVLPAEAEVRFAAANVFEILASGAVEGAVDADHGGRRIDSFPSGPDD